MSAQRRRQLLYFTAHFPYGMGERWKVDDLKAMSPYFDKVVIVPFQRVNGEPHTYCDIPHNVEIQRPLLPAAGARTRSYWWGLPKALLRHSLTRSEVLRQIQTGRHAFVASCLQEISTTWQALDEFKRRRLLNDPATDTSLFFFWGVGAANMIPFLKLGNCYVVVGFHGFDLYEERRHTRNFPFRRQVVQRADVLSPCSQHGADYLGARYPEQTRKIIVKRIGVGDCGVGEPSSGDVLQLASCAMVSPVKRLDLIVEAISKCKVPIKWTHIGGGTDLAKLKEYAKEKLARTTVEFEFTGFLRADDVRRFYVTNPIDLFISLSASEGVPVSIMEAMSAGVPVLATDVGGVKEIVDDSVGYLVEAEISSETVAKLIDGFHGLSMSIRQEIRNRARHRATLKCRAPDINLAYAQRVFGAP